MDSIQLYAVTDNGPLSLPLAHNVGSVHRIFDELPSGVYTALCTFQHNKFLDLEGHIERLERSCDLMGWSYQLDKLNLLRSLHKVCTEYLLPDARILIDVLAEPALELGTKSRLLIALGPFEPIPDTVYSNGVQVGITTELNRQQPLVKKAEFVLQRRQWFEDNPTYYECLMVDQNGYILEGTTSNFYAVRDGLLWTAGQGVLEGLARKLVLQVAAELSIPVKYEPISSTAISELDEAALSSSSRALIPIVQIGDQLIGEGKPGLIIQKLLAAYNEQVLPKLKTAAATQVDLDSEEANR